MSFVLSLASLTLQPVLPLQCVFKSLGCPSGREPLLPGSPLMSHQASCKEKPAGARARGQIGPDRAKAPVRLRTGAARPREGPLQAYVSVPQPHGPLELIPQSSYEVRRPARCKWYCFAGETGKSGETEGDWTDAQLFLGPCRQRLKVVSF